MPTGNEHGGGDGCTCEKVELLFHFSSHAAVRENCFCAVAKRDKTSVVLLLNATAH